QLSDFKGKKVVLYFYPKDDTTGCTAEACSIRDNYSEFTKNQVEILGVSIDSPKSHGKFAQKYDLPFTLMSDEEKKVVNLYQAWGEKKFMGRTYMGTYRISYLIDPKGIIRKTYENVKPADHAGEVIKDLNEIANH
ncbi:MAG: thioredoxin-dependent thiol peroxidase, partial [Candidatus Roizmanbacteria bacterium]